jgi:hypothetical protein
MTMSRLRKSSDYFYLWWFPNNSTYLTTLLEILLDGVESSPHIPKNCDWHRFICALAKFELYILIEQMSSPSCFRCIRHLAGEGIQQVGNEAQNK